MANRNKKIYDENDIEFLKSSVRGIAELTNQMENNLDRHFTIDGHLAGSIGEVLASYYYGISLSKANRKKYDGDVEEKAVQIKMTQRDAVDITEIPDYLIVLFIRISKDEVEAYEVFNGSGIIAVGNDKDNKNGWKRISLKKLHERNAKVPEVDRIEAVHVIKKYEI